jgi:hypothetical protein
MRPVRLIAAVVFAAAVAAIGFFIARSTADHPAPAPAAPVAAAPAGSAAKASATQGDTTIRHPVVLADGRHPVCLTAIDPDNGTITFDLVQWYFGEDAAREAAKDHQESSPPNDYYIRNLNPKLRTLPTRADAVITVNNLLNSHQSIPVTLPRLTTLTQDRSPVFWITVRHGQVLKISEQWVP